MAVQGVTGSVSVSGGNGYQLRFKYDQKYDIESNKSTVEFTAQAYHGSYAPTYADGCVYVNGNKVKTWQAKYAPDGSVVPNGGWSTISNGVFSVDIPHNQDGTCSFTISIGPNNWSVFLFANDSYSYTHDSFANKSWTITLTTIPRAVTSFQADNVQIGSACNLKWIPNSTAFAYKLRFAIGSWSATTGAITPGTTSEYVYTGYTIPMNVANQLPNSLFGTMNVTIYTYTNSSCTTQVGSSCSTTFTVGVPDSIIPTISSVAAIIDNSKNSIINDWNIAVAGYTKVNLTAKCSGAYGSSIVSYIISGGYNTTVPGDTLNYTGDAVLSSGAITFTIKAVDSRGRISSEKTTSAINFYAYSIPQIAALRAERLSTDDKKVNISAQWSISSIDGKNSAIYELKYKKSTSSSWNSYDGELINGGTTTLSLSFDPTASYNFRLLVQDTVGSIGQEECIISTMDVLLDFRAGGKGLGIGKICESDALEISLPTKLLNTISMEGHAIENLTDPEEDQDAASKAYVDRAINLAISSIDVFPVGFIYISVLSTSPAELFGGTWEQINEVFLLAAGDTWEAGTTGGEAEHKLTYNEMPNHSHALCSSWDNQWNIDWPAWTSYNVWSQYSSAVSKAPVYGTWQGGSAAHNNMPPYLAVYMWQRVA